MASPTSPSVFSKFPKSPSPMSPTAKSTAEEKEVLFTPRPPERPYQDILWRLSQHLGSPDDYPRLSRLLAITPTEETGVDYAFSAEKRAQRVHKLLVDWYAKELRHRLVEKDCFSLAEKCWQLLLGTKPPAVSNPWQIVMQSKAVDYHLSANEVRDWQFAGILPQHLELASEQTDGPHSLSVKFGELLPDLRETGRNGYKKFCQYIHRNSTRYVGLLENIGKQKVVNSGTSDEEESQSREQADGSQIQHISTNPDRLLWQLTDHLLNPHDYSAVTTVLTPSERDHKRRSSVDANMHSSWTTRRYSLFDDLNQFFALLWRQFANVVDSYTSHFSVRVHEISKGILAPATPHDLEKAKESASLYKLCLLGGDYLWQVQASADLQSGVLLAGGEEEPTSTHTYGQLFWFVMDTSESSGFYEFAGTNTDDYHTGLFLAANTKGGTETGKDDCVQMEVRKPAHGLRPSTFEKDFLFNNYPCDGNTIRIQHRSGLHVGTVLTDGNKTKKLCLGKKEHRFTLETPTFDG